MEDNGWHSGTISSPCEDTNVSVATPSLRIAVISPRPAAPRDQGSTVRTCSLFEHLSARHEVRQLTQLGLARGWRDGLGSDAWITPTYHERYYRHPLARLPAGWSERSWPDGPVAGGLGLRLAAPRVLDDLLGWADVTVVDFPWQFSYCVRVRPDGLFVYLSHNVEAVKFASFAEALGIRWGVRPWLRAIRRMEAGAVSRADLVVAVSAEDRLELVRRYGADLGRVIEVPNGADTERYASTSWEQRARRKRQLGLPDRPVVLFMGSSAPPNRAALRWIRRLAESTDRFTFLVVGPVARPRRDPAFVATGYVDDVRPYVEAADLAICPVEHGAGTKIKLWESLAAGLPSVAFPESTQGTGLRHGQHLLVAEKSEAALLAALERLADGPRLAGSLAEEARRLVVERHDWALGARTLEAALLQLVASRGIQPARRRQPSRLATRVLG